MTKSSISSNLGRLRATDPDFSLPRVTSAANHAAQRDVMAAGRALMQTCQTCRGLRSIWQLVRQSARQRQAGQLEAAGGHFATAGFAATPTASAQGEEWRRDRQQAEASSRGWQQVELA
jgi:hypothetical protein